MTMRSIEAKYEYDDEMLVEFDILMNRLDEVAAGADVFVLAGVLAALLVECTMQIEDMPEQEKPEFLSGLIATALMDHAQNTSTMQ